MTYSVTVVYGGPGGPEHVPLGPFPTRKCADEFVARERAAFARGGVTVTTAAVFPTDRAALVSHNCPYCSR